MTPRIDTSLVVVDTDSEAETVKVAYEVDTYLDGTVTIECGDDVQISLTPDGATLLAEAITRIVSECKSRMSPPIDPRD